MKIWSAIKWAYFIVVILIVLHAVIRHDTQTLILVIPGGAAAYILWKYGCDFAKL